jgi:hypothetical protein
MNKIVAIGDSHCDIFNCHPSRKRGTGINTNVYNFFDCRWLGPITFWRICRDKENSLDFENGVSYEPSYGCETNSRLEDGQSVILFFGEIDIRCHILKNQDYKGVVDDMVFEMSTFLNRYKHKYKIHIASILPPMRELLCSSPNAELPFVGSDASRSELTVYFNDKIIEMCHDLSLGYFDIYSIYVDDEKMLNPEKSDGIVHAMKNEDLENYIKNYFNIA